MKFWRILVIIFKDKWPLYQRICELRKYEFILLESFRDLKKYFPKYTPEKSINELVKKVVLKQKHDNKNF